MPSLFGAGARVVVTDATGREVSATLPYFAVLNMLHGGLFDFSADVGAARLGYATGSFDYDWTVIGTAHARYGLTDSLTVSGYGEFGAGLVNGSVGLTTNAGGFGTLSLAGSASLFEGAVGAQAYAAFNTTLFGVTIDASAQHALGDFEDLSSVTAQLDADSFDYDVSEVSALGTQALILGVKPPRAIDRLSLSVPVERFDGTLAASLINYADRSGGSSRIVTASFVRATGASSSLSASLFADLGGDGSFGASIAYSMALGDNGTRIDAGGLVEDGSTRATLEASRPLDLTPGSLGWDLQVAQGQDSGYQSAFGVYRSGYGVASARLRHDDGAVRGEAALDGALVATPDGVFAAERIDDAFAVVDVGAPDVEVFSQNRPIGKSDARGLVLVPNLVANEANRIAIDPTHLPVEAEIRSTQTTVTPLPKSGVSVALGVDLDQAPLSIVLVDAAGVPLDAGLAGHNAATGEDFVVGYDGAAYLRSAAAQNDLTVEIGGGSCTARIAAPAKNAPRQPAVVTCR